METIVGHGSTAVHSGLARTIFGTAHTLRHCFATHLVESGTDLQTVQALMGHRSIRSTAQYITLGLSTLSQTRSPLDRQPPTTTTD